ncbi:hypothetical protein [Planktosalinus lacus]|nr:hypothetical protein [Planktosalinus lacus]
MLISQDSGDSVLNKSNAFVFGLIILQLIAINLLVVWYEVETFLNLDKLLIVASFGFLVNTFISYPYRLYFFFLLSLCLLFLITGLTGMIGVMAIGVLVTLISVFLDKHLRNFLLFSIFLGLIVLMVLKPDWLAPHLVVVSTLGSMFIFRLSIFLFDKTYQKERPKLIKDITYFFMLPNMAILLFPAVDYKLFLRNYYNDSAISIYKKGVQWIVLGLFHLLVYRVIYYYFLLPPTEVTDVVSLWHYMTTNYLLIIRLSGLFHISVGVLCLFGFNLPRVFDNYFLASGFSDLWRRINIYFRDYLIKLFYYPLFFKLRKYGDLKAKVFAILVIFFITWFLHSFQWFWLRGYFPLRMVDIVFWGVFGVLVAGNAIWESRRKSNQIDKKSWKYSALMTTQILGMFLFMSVLWSIWSSTTMGSWFYVVKNIFVGNQLQYLSLFSILIITWILSTVIYRFFELKELGKVMDPDPKTKLASYWSIAMLFLLLVFQLQPVQTFIEKQSNIDLIGFLEPKLNIADENLLVDGYYEEILIGNELTNPVGEIVERRDRGRFIHSEGALLVDDIRIVLGKPNISFTFKDQLYSTNFLGIRDQNYSRIKPSNTIRTGILGGSYVNGSGIADDDLFDELLEQKLDSLNKEVDYEFWNFGNPGFDLIQCIYDFEMKEAVKYDFDNLIYVSHGIDKFKNIRTLATAIESGRSIPYGFVQKIIDQSNLDNSTSSMSVYDKLEPFADELVTGLYQHLYDFSLQNNIKPIWVYWPTTDVHPFVKMYPEDISLLVKEIGFTVIDLTDVYIDYKPADLFVAPKDRHPNALGHSLVADKLFEIIKNSPEILNSMENKED